MGICSWERTLHLNHSLVRKRTYAARLTALGLTVTLGFFAIFGYVLWESHNRDRNEALRSAKNLISTISSEIKRNLELYDLSLEAVVDGMKRPEVTHLSPDLRNLMLFDRAATAQDMGSIFVLDKNGSVIIDSRTFTPPAENHARRGYFIVHANMPNTGAYLSHPWLDSNGEFLIALSRRLTNSDGAFAGAVVGTLRLSYFDKMFRKLKLNDKDVLSITREDGVIVMRSPFDANMIGRNLSQSPIFRKISQESSGSFDDVATIDGVARMYVFQRIGESSLIVTYALSLDSIFADWRKQAWHIGLLILALCTINIALVAFLARALNRRSEAEYRLAIMAKTDSLTGLGNRRRLDEALDAEWRRALRTQSPVTLLMIDADKFKAYNDQFGHLAGDTALVAIARCIEGNARRGPDISARYGGEEFAVLLPETSVADAFNIAEKIRTSVLELPTHQNWPFPTVSIGVASIIPSQGSQASHLVSAADIALYEAKNAGRNRTELAATSRRTDRDPRLAAA